MQHYTCVLFKFVKTLSLEKIITSTNCAAISFGSALYVAYGLCCFLRANGVFQNKILSYLAKWRSWEKLNKRPHPPRLSASLE